MKHNSTVYIILFLFAFSTPLFSQKIREFHENGKLKLKGKKKNGLRIGKWIEYDTQGNLISKASIKLFNSSRQSGEEIAFYSFGGIKSKLLFYGHGDTIQSKVFYSKKGEQTIEAFFLKNEKDSLLKVKWNSIEQSYKGELDLLEQKFSFSKETKDYREEIFFDLKVRNLSKKIIEISELDSIFFDKNKFNPLKKIGYLANGIQTIHDKTHPEPLIEKEYKDSALFDECRRVLKGDTLAYSVYIHDGDSIYIYPFADVSSLESKITNQFRFSKSSQEYKSQGLYKANLWCQSFFSDRLPSDYPDGIWVIETPHQFDSVKVFNSDKKRVFNKVYSDCIENNKIVVQMAAIFKNGKIASDVSYYHPCKFHNYLNDSDEVKKVLSYSEDGYWGNVLFGKIRKIGKREGEGKIRFYTYNGNKLISKTHLFTNGVGNGTYEIYLSNTYKVFKNSILIESKSYYPNGTLKSETNINENCSITNHYNIHGILIMSQMIKNERLVTRHYNNGKLIRIDTNEVQKIKK